MQFSISTLRGLGFGLMLLAGLLLGGCNSSDDPAAVQGPGWPAVSGITMVNENNDPIGVYGSPVDGGLDAYPNPADLFKIELIVEYETHVKMWVDHAVGPGETTPTYQAGFGGAVVPVQPDPLVGVLVDGVFVAGPHQIVWAPRAFGATSGWYRISARIDHEVKFCNVYYAADENAILPGMWDVLSRQW